MALAALTQTGRALLDQGTYGFLDLVAEGRWQAAAAFSRPPASSLKWSPSLLLGTGGQWAVAVLHRQCPVHVEKDIVMTVELNHTIVAAHDKMAAATFLTDLLGLPAPTPFGPFLVVTLGNGVSLDFMNTSGDIDPQHYAFLVSEPDFDAIFGRIQALGLEYWADPFHNQPGEVNRRDGGRGVYFDDPNGHVLELITRPYGSGSEN